MKGINVLALNTATMIEAVQHWLNTQMVNPPDVTSIQYEADKGGDVFSIYLEEKKPVCSKS